MKESITASVPAEPPVWNLADLYDGLDDPRTEADLRSVEEGAASFADRHKGRIATLEIGAHGLADAIAEYERLNESATKPIAYANLLFAANTGTLQGAFLQKMRERTTAATLPLLFFDLELMGADAATLHGLLSGSDALGKYAHYLQTVQARAPYRLSESEERILEEQANTGRRAFARLFEEITTAMRFTVGGREGETLTLSQTLDLQHDANRAVRRASSDALKKGLEPHARTIAYIFNTLIQDKATEDRLRGHDFAEQARHIDNETTNDVVEAAMGVAVEGFPLVARYYKAKSKRLNLPDGETMQHYDRYAPLLAQENKITYDEARALCLESFAQFDAQYADVAREFFDGGWIDARPAPEKRGGAFCSYVTPDTHPYLFMTFLGKAGDVKTLAHELGHGIHASLSRAQGFLQFDSTLPLAEVASTFAEMLVFDARVRQVGDVERLSLYANQIEQSFGTIFRQAALYRFEQAIHHARRTDGELTVEQFSGLWQENVQAMFGDSVTMGEEHSLWWTYVRHFVASPFYVYAYTFGEMLSLAMYRRYQEMGRETFVPLYMEMLRGGGSKTPQELVAPMGIDLTDPDFWRGALTVLEKEVDAFEQLAEKISVAG